MRLLKRLHHYFYMGCVLFYFLLLYPMLYYFSRKPERYVQLNKIRKILSLLTSSSAGIFYRFKFAEVIDWSKPYIICPNHSSNLDTAAISLLARSNFAFLGKEELLDNFITKLFFKSVDIPVNRNSKIASFRAFKKAEAYLKDGISVIIFPEGGIDNQYPPVLQQFKNGPFRLAIDLQIPIIPVSIINSWKIMWDDGFKYGTRPGICDICVHAPIVTTGLVLEDLDSLKEKIEHIIKSGLQEDETG